MSTLAKVLNLDLLVQLYILATIRHKGPTIGKILGQLPGTHTYMVSNLRSVPRHGRGRGEVPGAEKRCLRRGYRPRAHAAPVPGLGCKRQVALPEAVD